MKNVFGIKAAVLVLSLLLVFGIAVFASEGDAVNPTPDIVSYNICYGETFKLQVAVKDESVPAGSTVTVNVYAEYPDEDSAVLDTFPLTRTAIEQLGGYFYVGTNNRAVSASALGTEFYMQAQYGEGDAVVKGNIVKYSVAEYLYEKLYLENFVSKTEADGKDYIRKTFYEGILAFGAGAQHLVLDEAPEYYMDKLSYCIVDDGTVNGKKALLANPGTELTVTYSGTENLLYLSAWNYVSLEGGNTVEYAVDANKSLTIAAPAEAFKLVPVFRNPYVMSFEGGSTTDEANTLYISNTPANGLTAGIVEDPLNPGNMVYGIVGTPKSNQHFRVSFTSGTNTTGDTYTFETKMYISKNTAGGEATKNFGYIDFRSGNVYAVNLYTSGDASKVNIQSNVKDDNGKYNNVAWMPLGEWFTFKMVTKTYIVDGVKTLDTFFYVNGQSVGSQLGVTNFGSADLSTFDATALNIKLNQNFAIEMYLDDLTFTRTQSED